MVGSNRKYPLTIASILYELGDIEDVGHHRMSFPGIGARGRSSDICNQ